MAYRESATPSRALTHTIEEIDAVLRRGLSPITDNRDALVALGFEPAYPQIRTGYDSTIWERSVEYGTNTAGYRTLARQRAFLA